MSGKKVHCVSLSFSLKKNSCNIICDGPILLVWVTKKKIEQDRWILKLFIVTPRANVHCVLDVLDVHIVDIM